MATFDGQLNTNKVFAALYNMIISLQVFPTGVSNLTGIYGPKKVDGTLYGDTKLYVSTDALKTYLWDGTDTPGGYNLLTVKRPPAPKEDELVIDVFRQIPVTVDNYLTKQAFEAEGTFSSFNGVILSWMQTTKAIYEHTTYTTNILVSASAGATLLEDISLATAITGLDALVFKAQELYKRIEDSMKELEEPSRSYNDHGFMRNYQMSDFDIIVPLGVLSSVKKFDVPFLFNQDGKPVFKEVHWKYFGTAIAGSGTAPASNTVIRAYVEMDSATGALDGNGNVIHYFPGDLLANNETYTAGQAYTAKYAERPDISTDIEVLVIHKQDYPIMSAFSVGTSFFNARRLDINHYLTFGHNPVDEAHLGERALLKFTTSNT